MDVAAGAVGIASFGIQICQGLLSYYNDWKGYDSDINSTYASIDDLSRTLVLLKDSLKSEELDEERRERVKTSLRSCEASLVKLSEKARKLRTHGQPEGLRQKAWTEIQKAKYPFQAKTLLKLQKIVLDIQERLKLAVQILQLHVSTDSQRILKQVAVDANEVVSAVAGLKAQTDRITAVQQTEQFKKITEWLSPPDPWVNHEVARQSHEPETGNWLLQSDEYLEWKTGLDRCLWLYGKAGCGKTILCSTAIDDIQARCTTANNCGYGVFFFSFSDDQKQSYRSLLRSLVAQLGWKEPGLTTVRRAYAESNQKSPEVPELERMLVSSLDSFDEVFVFLDALDECPDINDARETVLGGLERLLTKASNLKIMATSRELSDVRDSMQAMQSSTVPVEISLVDADIQKWLSGQLASDRKLNRLSAATKSLVEETIAQKAEGMFRWAYCQLQELKKLKSTKPKYVEHALHSLPATLDATYERMLTSIDKVYRDEAMCLLRWLAYARWPLSLGELAEAAIINPEGGGSVDIAHKGSLEDTLDILGALVTLDWFPWVYDDDDARDDISDLAARLGKGRYDAAIGNDSDVEDVVSRASTDSWSGSGPRVSMRSWVRLAHFSAKEYLESTRILESGAKEFHLDQADGHRFLAHSCLTYLIHYSDSDDKGLPNTEDETTFPLLFYAVSTWYYHSFLKESKEFNLELRLLSTDSIRGDWLARHSWVGDGEFKEREHYPAPCIYYASLFGLYQVVNALLDAGFDVNAEGGFHATALAAASARGHIDVVKLLIERGADISAPIGYPSRPISALGGAALGGHVDIVKLLLANGADINAEGRYGGSALHTASAHDWLDVVKLLLERGAEVNARGIYGSAFTAACENDNLHIARFLLGNGADIHAESEEIVRQFLYRAVEQGFFDLASLLFETGIDPHSTGTDYGSLLWAASQCGHMGVVQLVLEADCDDKPSGNIFEHVWKVPKRTPPTPPKYLEKDIEFIRERYPHAKVRLTMRLCSINLANGELSLITEPDSHQLPAGTKPVFIPEVSCGDCSRSGYIRGADSGWQRGFEWHLMQHERRTSTENRSDAKPLVIRRPRPLHYALNSSKWWGTLNDELHLDAHDR